jgi:tetratricopeptide (TPR) repeat protein
MGSRAAGASAEIDQRLRRDRQVKKLSEVWSQVADAYPANVSALITAANLAVLHDLDSAPALLERLRSVPVGESSALRDARAEASLGAAFRALSRGESCEKDLLQAASDETSAFKRDRSARELMARSIFLGGLAKLLAGDEGEARTAFARALKVAPNQSDQDQLDGILWGNFGVMSFLQNRLVDKDRAEQAVAAAQVLLDVIGAHSQYYPVATDGGEPPDDRVRTWLPVTIAGWTLHDLAQPELVESLLAPLVRLLVGSRYNALLLAQCYLLQGDAQVALGQPQAALAQYLAAEKIYRENEQEALRDELIDRDERLEPPSSAYRRVKDPSWYDNPWGTYYTSHRVRVERGLANVEATLFQQPDRAREHIRRAHELEPMDGDVRLLVALSEARRGERERALRLLGVVEPLLDRLYNLACVRALASQPDQALDDLERYLRDMARTDAARRMSRRVARSDPDLESLRTQPRFLALTQDG